ncbi:MAG: beta-galactosidase [Planctomycetia bacterium]|nr:beta-galactosidase [Planctomycetia bacterium]
MIYTVCGHTTKGMPARIVIASMAAATVMTNLAIGTAARPREANWTIRDGRLFVEGKWQFLKIGKPLRDFALPQACEQLTADLDTIQAKGFNAISLNCYWHHFDKDGDGTIDVSLAPLTSLIDAIHAKGMFPCLSVETYGVGGGQIPAGFWKRYPDALAVNADGKDVRDVEYGFGTAVPSLFHPAYREAVHAFIRALITGLPHRKILYYETTVEPQFMGHQDLDYSAPARRAYEAWLAKNGLQGPAWPDAFPVAGAFRADPVWLRFRAESLADWVNGDAAAFRAAAGADAYVAVDYLETCDSSMPRRNGNSVRFLESLTCADIIQVNWHWRSGKQTANVCAYHNVRDVMQRLGREWAVTEHMTLNGSDYKPEQVPGILRSTLAQGTGFGWEFVNLSASARDPFSLYNDDWSPKPLMAEVDTPWTQWQQEIAATPAQGGSEVRERNSDERLVE